MFKNILLPVDFEINTEMAVKKAIELSGSADTTIHLYHVQKPVSPLKSIFASIWADNSVLKNFVQDELHYKLSQWKELIEMNYPNIKVIAGVDHSTHVQKSIVQKAKEIKADLIIIGKHSYHKWFTYLNTVSPNKIAKFTGCPVLAFKPGSVYTKIRSIVVPIGTVVPQRKVELIVGLKQKFRISIHLVTVLSKKQNADDFSAYSLLETYRFLKDTVQCPLSHEVLHGENVAQSTFDYAKNIKADMLLLEPESETKLSSFPQKHIIDEMKPNSKLQILAVQP
jgi:nucleotide-binding universal stress UspA family protein